MNKHTPGPWAITGNRDAIEAQCPGAPYKIIIAETVGYKHIRGPNARLIAAAPDLLAALEWALSDAEDIAERQAIAADLGVSEWESFMPKWAADARAAIAKARGEC